MVDLPNTPELPEAVRAGARRLREIVRVPPVRTFPSGHAMVLALAGIVGLFAGIAAGLFSNFIALFQLLFFRPEALRRVLAGEDREWLAHFEASLRSAPWHLEYLVVAGLALAASRPLARFVGERRLGRAPQELGQRVRVLGWLIGFGLVLYYPLLVLTKFNRSFGEIHGGLYEMLQNVSPIWIVCAPAIGGLLAGLLIHYVTPESAGHGVVEVIEAVNVRDRRIPGRVAVWKSITAGLVVGSGGSAGREGPVVQIGSAIANELGVRFGLPRESVALLLACGGGAGIAASFNTPIGGTLFALEIILGDFGMRSIAPIAFAAVAATLTGRSLIGAGGEIAHLQFQLVSGLEISLHLVLGVLAAIVAVLYVRSVHGVEELFVHGRLARVPPAVRPMLGGFAVGLLALVVPRVLGNGYETMNAVLLGQLSVGTVLVVLVAKIVGTGFTLGSGAPGGSFFPGVFMGAMLGGAFGAMGHDLFPTLIAHSAAYAAVGMAAVVAAATQAPLTGIMMLFELTGSYEIMLPLMVACTTSVAIAHWILGGSMYSLKLRARGVDVGRVRRQRALHDVPVQSAMTTNVATIPVTATFADVLEQIRATTHSAFPVVDAAGLLLGMLFMEDIRPLIGEDGLAKLALVDDIARSSPPTVLATDSLEVARDRMTAERVSHIAVVDPENQAQLVGILSHRDILRAYEEVRAVEETPALPH